MDQTELEIVFKSVVVKHGAEPELANELWTEIEQCHSGEERHYHDLNHLVHFYSNYKLIKEYLNDPDSFLLALFYHDIIYDYSKQDNEQKSAELALKRLSKVNLPKNQLSKVEELILATKSHDVSGTDSDIAYFIDCDLSILGVDQSDYLKYCDLIRKEYIEIPYFLYNHGRSKFVESFLAKDRIFKTEYLYNQLEAAARQNLEVELTILDDKKVKNDSN